MIRVIACLLLLLPAIAHADGPASRLDEIIARGTLRVGLTGDYKPFSSRDQASGETTGLDVDMADNLAHSLGVKLEIVPTKWKDLLIDLSAQKFDIAMGGISVTLLRQKSALFSTPVMRAGKAAIARCAEADRFGSLEAIDKPGVKVIVNPGGTNETFDKAHLHAATIVPFPNNTGIFDALAAGEADVMITDAVETRLQSGLHKGKLCAIHPDQPFDFGELAYLLPRDVVWQEYVDQWLHLITENGERASMVAKWLPES
jgi:cyclohexadienyl dehydratase